MVTASRAATETAANRATDATVAPDPDPGRSSFVHLEPLSGLLPIAIISGNEVGTAMSTDVATPVRAVGSGPHTIETTAVRIAICTAT